MPTYVIIILMVSSCSLLLVLLFVVRKREQKKKAALEAGDKPAAVTAPKSVPVQQASQSNPRPSLDLGDLGALDDMDLSTSPMDELAPAALSSSDIPDSKAADLIELVSRYQFFQGENLMLFERMLKEQDLAGIEQIIREKFAAQGKSDAPTRAREVTKKLLGSMMTA